MILFDTETTGLVKPDAASLKDQPRIIEFAAIKLSDYPPHAEVERLEFLCNPGMPLPDIIKEITKLDDEDLAKEKSFAHYYPALCSFFLGEKYLVGHNVEFDVNLLRYDLSRIGKLLQFPLPPQHICTIQSSMGLKGHRLKLELLIEHITGEIHTGTHRAMPDVEDLVIATKWLIEKEMIKL